MNTRSLPTRPITSAEDLALFFLSDESLSNTLEEAKQIMSMPPDDWFGKTILFPRVVIQAQTEGQGDVVVSAHIVSFSWNDTTKVWDMKQHLAGRHGWNSTGPDHVDGSAIIPQRA